MSNDGQGKKGCKKAGRNRLWCAAYKQAGRRERNKALKILKHLRRAPWQTSVCVGALKRLPVTAVRDACSLYQNRTGYLFNYVDLLK